MQTPHTPLIGGSAAFSTPSPGGTSKGTGGSKRAHGKRDRANSRNSPRDARRAPATAPSTGAAGAGVGAAVAMATQAPGLPASHSAEQPATGKIARVSTFAHAH